MNDHLKIISILIYFLVGIICLVMALKCLFAKRYLPFHEEAASRKWDAIEKPLQDVILTILKISGLGFFTIFLLLTVFPVIEYLRPNQFTKFLIPVISFIYCSGLFLFNFLLFKKTKVITPWFGSLIAMLIIFISFILSII